MFQMRRRALIVAAGTLLIAPLSIVAQQPQRVWRIGVITARPRPLSLETDYMGAWIPRLREFGYLEGRDFSVDWRFADGNNERLPELAAELVRLQPDLILASGTPVARAMQKATSTIPIVIAGVADPVGFGLVASLSRPGGNITGPSIMATDVSVKSLSICSLSFPI